MIRLIYFNIFIKLNKIYSNFLFLSNLILIRSQLRNILHVFSKNYKYELLLNTGFILHIL